MKNSVKKIVLGVVLVISAFSVYSQAKKPIIMVVPSDVWCIKNGFFQDFDGKKIPDYKAALQNNTDVRVIISSMGDFMAQNEFPIVSLEQKLKDLENEAAENAMMTSKEGDELAESPIDKLLAVAKPDIILDLDFDKVRLGPQTQIKFNLQAIDAYSGKIISGNVGQGTPSGAVDLTNQLQEAVLSFKDNFLLGLINYFNVQFSEGREIKVTFKKWGECIYDFESEFGDDDDELGDIINDWFKKNTVSGRFSRIYATANMIKYEQVHIPMVIEKKDGTFESYSSEDFAKKLVKDLKKVVKDEDDNPMVFKRLVKGLGDVTIIMGGK